MNFGVIDVKNKRLKGLFSNMDETWLQHYQEQGYGAHDPFAHYAATQTKDLIYARENLHMLPGFESQKARAICEEGAKFGMHTSLVTPFHDSHPGHIVGFNLGSGLNGENFNKLIDRKKNEIQLGTALAQSFMPKLFSHRHDLESWIPLQDNAVKLTQRELEVLNWLANGLRVDRIAEKMNITNDTVHFHMKSIKRKLKAKTREHAIAIAFMENIIR